MNKKEFEKIKNKANKDIELYPYVIFICICYFCLSGLFLGLSDFFSGYILAVGIMTLLLSTDRTKRAKKWLKANS